MSNALIDDLRWRGLFHLSTDEKALAERLNKGPIIAYCGFDPSADSLTVGNLVPMVLLKRLYLAGHKPMLLLGGVTGMIGDPKPDSERQMLTEEQIAHNISAIKKQVQQFIGSDNIPIVNNADWLGKMSMPEYLRDVGKYFSVNVMMGKDSVTARMESSGISFTEFSYQTLQGYDFYYLLKEKNCELQCAGADQWGNITAGLDYIRKRLGKEAYAFCAPIITKADGKKFGKSESGAVWLDAKKTSPYQFYQFWLNVEDAKAAEYLKIYSFKPRAELEAIIAEGTAKPETRAIQRALAEELTELLHGKNHLGKCQKASLALFGQAELSDLDSTTIASIAATVCELHVNDESTLSDLAGLLVEIELVASKNLARQEIAAGGIYVNNQRATPETKLTDKDFIHGFAIFLRKGKKKFAVLTKQYK